VFVNGSSTGAPLFYVSPNQINFQMPVEATSTTASVVVVSNGLASPAVSLPAGVAVAGIFTVAGSNQAAANNADATPNSASNPAAAGSVISLFVTGLGPVSPAVATGQAGATAEPLNRTVTNPTVLIGGVAATNIQYSGLAPGLVGLYQLNVTIPQGTASGTAQVLVVTPAAASNPATIAIK